MNKPKIDITGLKVGDWTVIEEAPRRVYGKAKRTARQWLCECICGKRHIIQQYRLTKGTPQGCGCKRRMDLTGQQFGDWEVLGEGPKWWDNHQWRRTWDCVCVCGKRKNVPMANLRSGQSKGCGCYRRELAMENFAIANRKRHLAALARKARLEKH